MSAIKLASVGAQNCTVKTRKTGNALTTTCLSGTKVYRQGYRFRLAVASPWHRHWR